MSDLAVGIVVPTLGKRPEFLIECLESIRGAGGAYVLLVAPPQADLAEVEALGLFDRRIEDPGTGLAAAIDFGLTNLPEGIEFINWLGDDDKLMPGSLETTTRVLRQNPKTPFVYGGCHYIDVNGHIIWKNQSGRWASWLMRVGPDLIPQPGALIRRSDYRRVGGLNTDFGWAFDLDLFIRLHKLESCSYVNQTLACFRWHEGSLSVGKRGGSASESLAVRRLHLPAGFRAFSFIWEYPFIALSTIAARRLTRKSKSLGKQN